MKLLALKQLLFAAALLLAPLLSAQTMPRLEGKTLAGTQLVLPDAAHGHVTLVIFGFSKASGDVAKVWSTRFRKDYATDPHAAVYTVAEMQGIPGFIKGMVVGSMRRGTPEDDRSHFVPLFKDKEQWQQVVGFDKSGGDDAWLLLLDPQGVIHWKAHGRFSEALYGQLKQQVAALEGQKTQG